MYSLQQAIYTITHSKNKATFTQNLLLFLLHLLLFASMTRKTNILFFQPCALNKRETEISLDLLCEVEACQLVLCASDRGVCHSPLAHYGQPLNQEGCRFAMDGSKLPLPRCPSTSLFQRGRGLKYAPLSTMTVRVISLILVWPVSFCKCVSWCDSSR